MSIQFYVFLFFITETVSSSKSRDLTNVLLMNMYVLGRSGMNRILKVTRWLANTIYAGNLIDSSKQIGSDLLLKFQLKR